MRTLYLLSSPRPPVKAAEAVRQEAEVLRRHFGGTVEHLVPFSSPVPSFPLSFYGLHLLPGLWISRHERLHLFHSDLRDFPVLRASRRRAPLFYTVTTGVSPGRLPRPSLAARLAHVAVPTEADRALVADWAREAGVGLGVSVVVPGVDRERFRPLEPPAPPSRSAEELVLLAGSAPWTEAQFESKGLDALFEVVRELADTRLVLLWRGLLRSSLDERIRRWGLEARVEVHEEAVDVVRLLRRAHAGIVLAARRELVKGYPHSLLEALTCGRPVICSGAIALSGYVRDKGCGLVVEDLEPCTLRGAILELRRGYERYRRGAAAVAGASREFSTDVMIAAYEAMYRSLD